MTTQAKLGLTIGVLTGIGNQHDLSDADVLVLDVNECVDMVLPNERQGQYNNQEDAGSNPSTERFFRRSKSQPLSHIGSYWRWNKNTALQHYVSGNYLAI